MVEPDRPPDHVELLTCDFSPATVVGLRHRVTRHARDNGLSGRALYRFVAAVNEIVTNAVRHGGGTGHLRLWRVHNHLYCRVTDHGTGLPLHYTPRRPDPRDLGGRGLWLAGQAIDELTIDSGAGGTTVTLSVAS